MVPRQCGVATAGHAVVRPRTRPAAVFDSVFPPRLRPRRMPELPEVEFAATRLRTAVAGRVIARLEALHPSQQRHLPEKATRAAVGLTIERVERRLLSQLLVMRH